MKRNKITLLRFLLILILIFPFIKSKKSFADDKDLFSVKVKPNILFILDNSGSMSSGDVVVNDFQSFQTYTTSTGRTFTYPRYSCLEWSGGVCVRARVRRYIAMRRITTELLDNFRNDAYMGIETFFYTGGGSYRSLGGQIRLSIKDLSTPDKCEDTSNPSTCTENLDMMFDIVNGITADEYTPLAESLDTAYGYYKGSIFNGDGNTFFDYNSRPRTCSSINNAGYCTNSSVTSPLKWWCQKNFVILLTDGAPTSDEFDNHSTTAYNYYPYISDINTYRWDYDGDNDYYDTKRTSGHLLDDVAKYIYDHDLVSNDKTFFNLGDDYPSDFNQKQNIITYTVGLRIDIQLLENTARNGHGEYFTVDNYTSLKDKLLEAIYDILQRTYAFTSFTAPKKLASGENITFIGYFLPKYASIWEGHLVAKELVEKWCVVNDQGELTNCIYDSEEACESANTGKTCESQYSLSTTPKWDAADKVPAASQRNLYTYNGSGDIIEFSTSNLSTLKPLLDVTTDSDATRIINFIRGDRADSDPPYKLGDIFHSDIQFIGSPLAWKKALDPSYETFYENHKNRKKVVYFGTNDGILHEVDADPDVDPTSEGKELYGFIPDEVLPKLKEIVLDKKHKITVDGRISADDIFYTSGGNKIWRTMLYFGLRNGGKAYYAFDVSDPDNPTFKWKFGKVNGGSQPSYVQYLGYSWGKPAIGMIKYKTTTGDVVDKYVVILPGGYADNDGDSSSLEGKAIFFVDAWTGDLLWMLGYANSDEQTSDHYLTSNGNFNYPIPSSLTAVDLNNDNYIDTIYFGNTYGNLFKLDISDPDPENWEPVLLFHATYGSGDTKQPIYLSPAIAYDNCYNLWVTFGTGDRTNMKTEDRGRLIAIKDTGSTEIELGDLQQISWSGDTFNTTYDETKKGFYFDFPSDGEKIFDPEPIILPDDDMVPHLYFNTYQPPKGINSDPCASGGEMVFYNIKISTCPAGKISGEKEEGRVAGGGFLKGNEYIMYEGNPELGSTTLKKVKKISLPYAGGLVYWKEKRR